MPSLKGMYPAYPEAHFKPLVRTRGRSEAPKGGPPDLARAYPEVRPVAPALARQSRPLPPDARPPQTTSPSWVAS
jgi:hypothetical protein